MIIGYPKGRTAQIQQNSVRRTRLTRAWRRDEEMRGEAGGISFIIREESFFDKRKLNEGPYQFCKRNEKYLSLANRLCN